MPKAWNTWFHSILKTALKGKYNFLTSTRQNGDIQKLSRLPRHTAREKSIQYVVPRD